MTPDALKALLTDEVLLKVADVWGERDYGAQVEPVFEAMRSVLTTALAPLGTETGWQPISTLPKCTEESSQRVLVWSSKLKQALLCDEPPKHLDSYNRDLTHWAALPESPKEQP